jgi:diguanylate cyclase (GGDEF)-like protein
VTSPAKILVPFRRRRNVRVFNDGRLLRATSHLFDAARRSVGDVFGALGEIVATENIEVDLLALFSLDGDELRCDFARGRRAASYERLRLRSDGKTLPAGALATQRCAVSPIDGCAIVSADRSAIAVPWIDGDAVQAIVYAASIHANVQVAALMPLLAMAGQPFVMAREREEERREADFDELTGLLTSRAFRRRFDAEFLAAAARRPHPAMCLWFVDADGFKSVNDRLGHRAGDEVLRTLAALVRAQTIDGFDFAARNGGDEFCLLARSTEKTRAIERARALCDAVNSHASALSGITASIGVAAFPHDAASAAELLETADRAMYHSKRTGRNRVSYLVRNGRWASIEPKAAAIVPRTSSRWEERSGESFSGRSLR